MSVQLRLWQCLEMFVRSAQSPHCEDVLESWTSSGSVIDITSDPTQMSLLTWVVYSAILVENPFSVLLLPTTILLLSAHNKLNSALNCRSIWRFSIDHRQQGPGRHHHLTLLMLTILLRHARLQVGSVSAFLAMLEAVVGGEGRTYHVRLAPASVGHLLPLEEVARPFDSLRVDMRLSGDTERFEREHRGVREANSPRPYQ